MRNWHYFMVKLKHYEIQPGKIDTFIRMPESKIVKLFESLNYICINGIVFDENENIVGNVLKKEKGREIINKKDFNSLPLREIMLRLGSLSPQKWQEIKDAHTESNKGTWI